MTEKNTKSTEGVRRLRDKRKAEGWSMAKLELPLHPKIKRCQLISGNKKSFMALANKLVSRMAVEMAYDFDRLMLLRADRVLDGFGLDCLQNNESELVLEFNKYRMKKINEAIGADFVEFVRLKHPELFANDTDESISRLSKLIKTSIAAANEVQELQANGKGDDASKTFGKFYGAITKEGGALSGICIDFVFQQMSEAGSPELKQDGG